MAIKNIGRTFKTKSGKSTRVIFSMDEIKEMITEHDKYGKQVSFFVSGTADSQYGHGVFIMTDDEVENKAQHPPQAETTDIADDMPF